MWCSTFTSLDGAGAVGLGWSHCRENEEVCSLLVHASAFLIIDVKSTRDSSAGSALRCVGCDCGDVPMKAGELAEVGSSCV